MRKGRSRGAATDATMVATLRQHNPKTPDLVQALCVTIVEQAAHVAEVVDELIIMKEILTQQRKSADAEKQAGNEDIDYGVKSRQGME